ncbi:MAG: RecQ family ATP-dependent DNA helicase [Chloroflexota bacterium]|nr:RecQ family ATP-dependent DNA helicase [Chloroflexota bacterium]
MSSEAMVLDLLCQALQNKNALLRSGQLEAIQALVDQRSRVLVVQHTGWGKSMVYFLATRLLRDLGAGPTLLISPLLALMRNQIAAAERIGIRAATINSSNRDEWYSVQDRFLASEIDILLVSPERLANKEFREQVLLPTVQQVGLFVVDEAHCISDWGHDFRPDYQRITRIVQAMPRNVPVLATTATANDRVVADVAEQLGPGLTTIRGSLARDSLRLQNIALPSQAARLAWLAEQVPKLPGNGIIYTLTVKDAERVSEWLQIQGIAAHSYHGRLDSDTRVELEDRLLANGVKALAATTALGMGFDKPDLGFVIHYQRPGSVVHYYQQVGRAGRAVDDAYGIMLSGAEDKEITEHFIRSAFPPEGHATAVMEALAGAGDGLSLTMLKGRVNLSHGQIEKVLKVLAVQTPSPVTKRGSRWYRTPVHYLPDRERIQRLSELRRAEQAQMEAYLNTDECLMAFLRRELSDPQASVCGRCASCVGEPLLPTGYSHQMALQAVEFLRRSEVVIEQRKRWIGDGLASHGWCGTIDPALRPEEGRALCLWGDAGWGAMVEQGKQVTGSFDDRLVSGAIEMIRSRWLLHPFPTWVTCIPSLRRPTLVEDLARAIARDLGLPFSGTISKVRENSPQKIMQNSFQQAANLADVFSIQPWSGIGGPVLLVDDIVDSRWTLTVAAALLREAGSGPVYPLALAMATPDWSG